MKTRPSCLLFLVLLGIPPVLQAQGTSWVTSTFLGSLWRSDGQVPTGDSSYVEPDLRPMLPSGLLHDLRYSRFPGGDTLSFRLAVTAGLFDATVHRPSIPIGTDSLLALLAGVQPASADLFAYARLRLFDLLLGDWSRSPDDVEWYPLYLDDETVWNPFPTPYWNAFTRYDGLIPWFVLQSAGHMTSWSDDLIGSYSKENPMRVTDRRLLSAVPWSLWDSAAATLTSRLGGDALDRVFSPFAGPLYGELRASLGRRVRQLPELARTIHRHVSRYVEFRSTPVHDSIFVKVISARAIEVSRSGERGGPRLLNSLTTEEVRFLLREGPGSLWLEGPEGVAFDIIADLDNERSSVWYRRSPAHRWERGIPSGMEAFTADVSPSEENQDDAWGELVTFIPWLDGNEDDKLFLGGGPEITTSHFRTYPYATRTTVLAGVATRTRRYRLRGEFETRTIVRSMGFGVIGEYSQLNISNFHGIGNETVAVPSLLDRGYYKADQRLLELGLVGRAYLSDALSVGVSPLLRIVRTDPRPGSLIDSLISSGFARRLNYPSIRVDALYDSRDRTVIPTRGFFAAAEASWFPRGLQNRASFASLGLDSRYYHFIGREGTHLMVRTMGEAVIGDHPWFESAFLGGSKKLRGYERQRFAGDASLLGVLEARVPLGRVHLLWPFEVGAIAFAESGRVFARGESSRRWHSSAGGGMWFHSVRSPYSLILEIAASSELTEFLATFGLPVDRH